MRRLIETVVVLPLLLATIAAQAAVTIDVVAVGNPGNLADTTGYGSVDYAYSIGKYEVTAGQYTEFLNGVADTDTYGLYNTNMTSLYGCQIQRSGSPGSYTYSVASDWANRPVNFVSWGDAVRFSNWLHNGQPTGTQGDTTTEDGAYDLNGATTHEELALITQESDASWFIPTLSEWYKAAYHQNNGATGDYWDYPTSSDTAPLNTVVDPDPGNNANFRDDLGTGDGTYTVGSPYWTTEVGEFENSESPYGTFDQGGNIWEWTTSGGRALGGGTWARDVSVMHASAYWSVRPAYEGSAVGFRMASSQVVPEPASVAVWSFLAFCGIVYARRRMR